MSPAAGPDYGPAVEIALRACESDIAKSCGLLYAGADAMSRELALQLLHRARQRLEALRTGIAGGGNPKEDRG